MVLSKNFKRSAVLLHCLALVLGLCEARSQDVVIEDPIPLLKGQREKMATRPLVKLGTVNPFLHNAKKATSPYNTTMLIYDPLHQTPEGEEVTLDMLCPEVRLQEQNFFERLWTSITNLLGRK